MNPTPHQDKEALTQEPLTFEQWWYIFGSGHYIAVTGDEHIQARANVKAGWDAHERHYDAEITSLKEQLKEYKGIVRATLEVAQQESEQYQAKISALTTAGDEMFDDLHGEGMREPSMKAWTAATSMKG